MTFNEILPLATTAMWVILIASPVWFLCRRWKNKYNFLEGSFNDQSFELYYKLFKPAIRKPDDVNYRDLFHTYFKKGYGRRTFVLPLGVFCFVTIIGSIAVWQSLISIVGGDANAALLPPIALSALMGAYMWVGYDQIVRFRTEDLTIHDVSMWSLRFLVSIPIGYSFSYLAKEPLGIPIAFFCGAFPLKSLQTIMRRMARKYLKIGDEADQESSELQNLQGIEKKESERLKDEGVSNILQLAYCDPIDLTMKTTFDFLYLIDIKAQAILWIYLGNRLNDDIRRHGLRSAHEAYILMLNLNNVEYPEIREFAENIIQQVSTKLAIGIESVENMLHEVADDPHTIFLFQIWCNDEFDSCVAHLDTGRRLPSNTNPPEKEDDSA